MRRNQQKILSLILLVLLGIVFSGCNKKAVKPGAGSGTQKAGGEITGAGETVTGTELDTRGLSFEQNVMLENVYFDFDQYNLTQEARTMLTKNAEWLLKNPEIQLQVAGHCDERGTVEYNLSLGDKRAKTVRDYYYRSGVGFGRMATISYGKEKPLDPGHNEQAWDKNRRAETLIKK